MLVRLPDFRGHNSKHFVAGQKVDDDRIARIGHQSGRAASAGAERPDRPTHCWQSYRLPSFQQIHLTCGRLRQRISLGWRWWPAQPAAARASGTRTASCRLGSWPPAKLRSLYLMAAVDSIAVRRQRCRVAPLAARPGSAPRRARPALRTPTAPGHRWRTTARLAQARPVAPRSGGRSGRTDGAGRL